MYNTRFVFILIYFIVENLIGMLYSDVAERNVGKSLTLETFKQLQRRKELLELGTPFIVLEVTKQ